MTYDYFYGQQAEMFAFYRVPKVLFTEDCFWNVSTDAKLLYGILLDRMNLSARNGWLDEEGRVYIIFTIEEIKGALGCAEKKAVKLLDELEKKCGLIERKRQGLGKPNLIYVKNFISGSVERQFLNCQKDNSGVVKNTIQELSKAQGNNTDTNYIDFSDTDPFFPSGFCGKEVDETDEFTRYYQYFYEQLSMDYLKQDYPYDHEILDLILHLIIEVMCSNRKQIRIASDDKPIEIVKSSFMKLDSEHIRFVMSSFKENTTDVRNIKQYHDTEGRTDHRCGVVFQPQRHRNIPRQAAQSDTCRQLAGRSRAGKNENHAIGTARTKNGSPGRFLFENPHFPQVKSRENSLKNAPLSKRGRRKESLCEQGFPSKKRSQTSGLMRKTR